MYSCCFLGINRLLLPVENQTYHHLLIGFIKVKQKDIFEAAALLKTYPEMIKH